MELKELDLKVFPSDENTIGVMTDENEMEVGYENACHKYRIRKCLGFKDGKTEYMDKQDFDVLMYQDIQFVQKNVNGSIIPGVQSEQLALVILHRLETMNKLFPCPENEKQMAGINMYLEGCKDRVQNRIGRGVMGDLKK